MAQQGDHKSVLGPMPAVERLNLTNPITLEQKAKIVFEYLAELKTEHYQFSNAQMDIAVGLPLRLLPPNDVHTLYDVARQSGVPFWQGLYAQFRRNNEQGYAYALMLDPGWIAEETVRLAERECAECHKPFVPQTDGQIYCTDLCGSAKDRRAYAERQRQAGDVNAVVSAPIPIIVDDYGPFAESNRPDGEKPGFIPTGTEALAARLREQRNA